MALHTNKSFAPGSKSKGKFTLSNHKAQDAPAKRKRNDSGPSRSSKVATRDSDDGGEDDDLLGEDAAGESNDASEADTEDEIENAREGKSKKTQKRKRRAISPTSFGEALSAFLGDDDDDGAQASAPKKEHPTTREGKTKVTPKTAAHQAPIFSLAPSVRSRISSIQLNAKASRIALEERRRREEQYRVRDLIGGWGKPGERPGQTDEGLAVLGEDSDGGDDASHDAWFRDGGSKGYERRLRKVAQRGVVKLFNAIRAAQSTTDEDLQDKEKTISSSTHAGPLHSRSGQDTVSGKNALGGKSKELADLSKSNFLDMIRSGKGGATRA
ncbi:unnamed protein product [Sympodiomycopsis kandeliae]